MHLNPAGQLLQGRSTAMQGSSMGRIVASKGCHVVSQPPIDVQRQIEGTQLPRLALFAGISRLFMQMCC